MANPLVALAVQGPDFANEFNRGADAAQGRQMNALRMQGAQQEMGREQAKFLMETLGSAGMAALGGDINGKPDPEKWREALTTIGKMVPGIDVDSYINNPGMARTLVDASITAQQAIQRAQNDREFNLALKKFDFDMMDANRRFALAAQKASEPGYRTLSPDEVKGLGLPPGAYQIGGDGKISAIGGGGVTVKNIGSIPPGYRVQYDEAGNPVSMEPIAGSPAEAEGAAARDSAESKAESQTTWNAIVNQEIGRALKLIDDESYLPKTGFGAETASGIGGTKARDLKALLDTVKANAGFDRLQAMRDASPTGSALGQVSEREIDFLQATVGSLEQGQSKEQIVYNLNRLKRIYQNMLSGKRAYDGMLGENDGGEKPAPGDGGIPKPASKAEFDALPSGAEFIAPDGSRRRKP